MLVRRDNRLSRVAAFAVAEAEIVVDDAVGEMSSGVRETGVIEATPRAIADAIDFSTDLDNALDCDRCFVDSPAPQGPPSAMERGDFNDESRESRLEWAGAGLGAWSSGS